MIKKRCKILIIDKKNRYNTIFEGFRKSKFNVTTTDSISEISESELSIFNVLFIVIYDSQDLSNPIKYIKMDIPIIVATENGILHTTIKKIGDFQLIDFSLKINLIIRLYNCLTEISENTKNKILSMNEMETCGGTVSLKLK